MEQINKVVDEAEKLIGVRWKQNGRDKNGLDCIGLVVYATTKAGFGDGGAPKTSPLRPGPEFIKLFSESKDVYEVPITQTKAGDIGILRYATHPTHCGIITEDEGRLSIIHSIASRKRVVKEPLDSLMKCKHIMTFRIKNG